VPIVAPKTKCSFQTILYSKWTVVNRKNPLVAVELDHAHFGWRYPFKSLTVLLSACHIRFVNRRANRLIRFNPTGLAPQLFFQRLPERLKVCQRHQGRTRQFVLRPNLLTLVRAQIAAKVFEQHNDSLDSAASFGVFRFVPVNGWPIHGCILMRFVQIIRQRPRYQTINRKQTSLVPKKRDFARISSMRSCDDAPLDKLMAQIGQAPKPRKKKVP
jgi:hypothetical protein